MNQGNDPKLNSYIFTLASRKGKSTRAHKRNREWTREDSEAQVEDKRKNPIIGGFKGAANAKTGKSLIKEKKRKRRSAQNNQE